MNEQANRDRLATAVVAARRRKFKTVDKARVAAGVARGTWEKVERGEPIKDFSLASIEEALDWPEGRATAMLHGDPMPADVAEAEPDLGEMMRELRDLRRDVDALRGEQTAGESETA